MVTESQAIDMMHTIGLSEIARRLFSEQAMELRTLYVDGDENIEVTIRLDTLMQVYAMDAQKAAKEQFSVELDFSPESLRLLDEIIAQQHKPAPKGLLAKILGRGPDAESVTENARLWSGYAGQVMHRYSSVTWGLANDRDTGRCHIILVAGDLVLPIVHMTTERINTGRGQSFVDTFEQVVKAAPLP